MNKIYRYELEITDEQTINMPPGDVIAIGQVDTLDHIEIWVHHTNFNSSNPRDFRIVGTGNPFHPEDDFPHVWTHLGTTQRNQVGLVWHVFEVEAI